MTWSTWIPSERDELIGESARQIYDAVRHTLTKVRDRKGSACTGRFLFSGTPGCGKTTIANMLAEWWVDHELHISTYDGVSVSIDTVEKIEKRALSGSLWGKYSALIINECDLVTQGAQNKLLGFLERLPEGYVVFGTSNLKPVTQGVLDSKQVSKKQKSEEWLVPRYASRFVQYPVKTPTIQEAATDVSKLTGAPLAVCEIAARKASGDNRQLLTAIEQYESALEIA